MRELESNAKSRLVRVNSDWLKVLNEPNWNDTKSKVMTELEKSTYNFLTTNMQ